MKNVQKLNEQVLQQGIEDDHSWHRQYKDSAYIFVGNNGIWYWFTLGAGSMFAFTYNFSVEFVST